MVVYDFSFPYNGTLPGKKLQQTFYFQSLAWEPGAGGPWPPRFCNFFKGIRFLLYKSTLFSLCGPPDLSAAFLCSCFQYMLKQGVTIFTIT